MSTWRYRPAACHLNIEIWSLANSRGLLKNWVQIMEGIPILNPRLNWMSKSPEDSVSESSMPPIHICKSLSSCLIWEKLYGQGNSVPCDSERLQAEHGPYPRLWGHKASESLGALAYPGIEEAHIDMVSDTPKALSLKWLLMVDCSVQVHPAESRDRENTSH